MARARRSSTPPRAPPSPRLVPSSSLLRDNPSGRISPFHRLANNLARSKAHRKFFLSFVSPVHRNEILFSLSLLSTRNNLRSRHRTAEFIAASLPETRPQENLLVKKADLLDLSVFLPLLTYVVVASPRSREREREDIF